RARRSRRADWRWLSSASVIPPNSAGCCARLALLLGERGDGAGQELDLAADLLGRLLAALADLVEQPLKIDVEIADVRARRLVEPTHPVSGEIDKAGKGRTQLHLALGQLDHQALVRPHLVAKRGEPLGQS